MPRVLLVTPGSIVPHPVLRMSGVGGVLVRPGRVRLMASVLGRIGQVVLMPGVLGHVGCVGLLPGVATVGRGAVVRCVRLGRSGGVRAGVRVVTSCVLHLASCCVVDADVHGLVVRTGLLLTTIPDHC